MAIPEGILIGSITPQRTEVYDEDGNTRVIPETINYVDQQGREVRYIPPTPTYDDEGRYIQTSPEQWVYTRYDDEGGVSFTPYQSPTEVAFYDRWAGATNKTDKAFLPTFLSVLKDHLPAGQYSEAQILDAAKASNWWGKLGSGSNPYNAAWEVTQKLGADTSGYDQATSERYRLAAEAASPEGQARAEPHGGLFGGGGNALGLGDLGNFVVLAINMGVSPFALGEALGAAAGFESAVGAAAMGGANALVSGQPLENVLESAGINAVSALAGQAAGGGIVGGAVGGATKAALTGEDIATKALIGAGTAAARGALDKTTPAPDVSAAAQQIEEGQQYAALDGGVSTDAEELPPGVKRIPIYDAEGNITGYDYALEVTPEQPEEALEEPKTTFGGSPFIEPEDYGGIDFPVEKPEDYGAYEQYSEKIEEPTEEAPEELEKPDEQKTATEKLEKAGKFPGFPGFPDSGSGGARTYPISGGQPLTFGISQLLSNLGQASAPPGELESTKTGKKRENVWNRASLKNLQDALGV
jgi:hypothetical protein